MEETTFLAESVNNTEILPGDASNGPSNLSSKFDQETWTAVEQKMSSGDIDILKVLVEYASGVDASTSKMFKSISDEYYCQHRQSLFLQLQQSKTRPSMRLNLVIGDVELTVDSETHERSENVKHKKKEKIKPLSRAEQIRKEHSVGRIGGFVKDILQTFKTNFSNVSEISISSGMSNDIVEIKGICLLYACAWINFHFDVFNVETQYENVFDIIATTQKFINICKNPDMLCTSLISGDCKPSKMMIIDLERWVQHLRSRFVKNGECVFNWTNIQKFAPSIFTQSKYPRLLPQQQVKLKDHQKKIIDAVRECIDTGLWGIYDAMIGSGKTTGQIGIAALVAHLRISNPSKYGKLRMLSVCNSEAVRLDVAQKLYNIATTFPEKKLHFAISSVEYDNHNRTTKAKIIKNNACPSNDEIVTVVASPLVAKLILESNDNLDDHDPLKYTYILFNDEPNMGADNLSSKQLRDNVALNHVTPYITINSSATFPTVDMLNTITTNFFERHPTAKQLRVYSNEISIGCDIRTLAGEIVVPHLGTRNSRDLATIVNSIKGCAFLGKAYTPTVVDSLYNKMIQHRVNDLTSLPNVPLLFTEVSNLNINRVRETAMELLDILTTMPDNIIEAVCETNITDGDDEEEDDETPQNLFSFSSNTRNDDVPSSQLEYTKLGTTQAYRLQGQTLIATRNPEQFVLDNFSQLIDEVYASETRKVKKGSELSILRYKSTGDALRRYSAELEDWQKKIPSIERNATSPDDLVVKMADHEQAKPTFNFPSWAHVGTVDHVNKFAQSHKDKLVGTLARTPLHLPYLTDPKNIINVDDRILTALYCGVAIYSTETVKCRVYLDIVLRLASIGALAYVVADSSICFGTNYPFLNVIITQEFSEDHGMLVLYQVMGRAGRPGKSPKALIIVPDVVARRIINYLTQDDEANREAVNMECVFQYQLKEIQKEQEIAIERQVRSIAMQHGISLNVVKQQSSLTVIPTLQKKSEHDELTKEIVETPKETIPIQLPIVPISKVPDRNVKTHSGENRSSQRNETGWRNTKPHDSQPASSGASEWKRAVQMPASNEKKPEQPRQSSNFNGGKYVPPHTRNREQYQSEEKAPRYKAPNGRDRPSSSSGWKKESK